MRLFFLNVRDVVARVNSVLTTADLYYECM
jgi:hypothetical protein